MDFSVLTPTQRNSLEKVLELKKANPSRAFQSLIKDAELHPSTVNAATNRLGFKGIKKFWASYSNGLEAEPTVVTYDNASPKRKYNTRTKATSSGNAFILVVPKSDLASTLKDLIGE